MKVNVISESAFTVQGHGVHTAFVETVDALKSHTDCRVSVNDSAPADIVHIHTIGPYSLNKLLFNKGRKVVSAHVTPDSFVGSLVGAKYWYGLARWYLRWFYNRADAVLGVSNEVVSELKAMGVKRPIFLMPNIINIDAFKTTKADKKAAREHLGIPQNEFIVIASGQVQPRKRVDVFITAAQKLPKLSFVWVGGMPFKKLAANSGAMQRLMDDHPTNLTFTGLVKREELVNYYQAADLFFLPSNQETFGIVIVEAAAVGLPVLLRDLDQYRVTFGSSYERGTDNTFVRQIERFADDPDYYQKWQTAASEIARRYDAKTGAQRLLQIYQQVLAQK